MRSSGTVPHGGVAAGDVPGLAELLERPGPFASVYLNTEGAVEDAPQRLAIRWKNLRRRLANDGADEAALAGIDPVVEGAHAAGETLVVVATPDGVALARHEPALPRQELARFGSLPLLTPLIEAHQAAVPHVVVLADRLGADAVAFRRDADDVEHSVDGPELHVTRSAPGGWSQRRFQQRAENVWETNAKEVADALVGLVDEADARLVVAAGDVRALQFLRRALPERVDELVRTVGGSRAGDGSVDAVAPEADRLVREVAEVETAALLEKFAEERGQGDRAADGPARTLDALARVQVHTLLVHDDPADGRTAWFGPAPTEVAADEAALRASGVDEPRQARLVDVAVRAALGTGGAVRVLSSPEGVTGGLGAVLRYAVA